MLCMQPNRIDKRYTTVIQNCANKFDSVGICLIQHLQTKERINATSEFCSSQNFPLANFYSHAVKYHSTN